MIEFIPVLGGGVRAKKNIADQLVVLGLRALRSARENFALSSNDGREYNTIESRASRGRSW